MKLVSLTLTPVHMLPLFLWVFTHSGTAAAEQAPAAVVPVLFLDASTQMEVKVAFVNTSGKPLTYIESPDGNGVYFLEILLFQREKFIEPRVVRSPPPISADLIRVMKAGDSALVSVRLREEYGKLKPGQYELRIRYDVPANSAEATKYGLTPFKLKEQTVLHLIIK